MSKNLDMYFFFFGHINFPFLLTSPIINEILNL